MKKFFISMSVLLTIAISSPVISSARSSDDVCPATAGCVNPGVACNADSACAAGEVCHDGKARHHKHDRKDKKYSACDGRHCHKGDVSRRGADGCFAPFLFDGIQLSDAQKADLQVLRSNLKKERKDFDDATKARAKTEKRQMRQESKKKFDEGIKNILTKEQYTKFQENKVKLESRRKDARAGKTEKSPCCRTSHHNKAS